MVEEKENEIEIDGWICFEEENSESEKKEVATESRENNALESTLENAKKSFKKSIKAGNIGAYAGLSALTENREEKIKYLELAAFAGRLDAIWDLYLAMEDCLEKYAWLTIAVDNTSIPDAKKELAKALQKLSPDEKVKVTDICSGFLDKIKKAGYKLVSGVRSTD